MKKLSFRKENLRVLNESESTEVNAGVSAVCLSNHTCGSPASCYNTAFHLSCAGLSDCVC